MSALLLLAALSADVAAPLTDTSDTVAVVADLRDWLGRLAALDPKLRDPLRPELRKVLGFDPFAAGAAARAAEGPHAFGSMKGVASGVVLKRPEGTLSAAPDTSRCPPGDAHLMLLHGLPGRPVSGRVAGCHVVRLEGGRLEVDGFVDALLGPIALLAPQAPDERVFARVGATPGLVRLRGGAAGRALLLGGVLAERTPFAEALRAVADTEVAVTFTPARWLVRVRDEVEARRQLPALGTRRPPDWPEGAASVADGYLVFGVDVPGEGDFRDVLPADLRPYAARAFLVVDATPTHPLVWPHLRQAAPALASVGRIALVAWYDDGLRYKLRASGLSGGGSSGPAQE